jgi:hypothetical protein
VVALHRALIEEVKAYKAALTPGELALAVELEKLRMSLARVAQRAGLREHVPGNGSASQAHLLRACYCEPRGWNALAARLVGWVDQAREDQETLEAERAAEFWQPSD